jgi:hypothetical protein
VRDGDKLSRLESVDVFLSFADSFIVAIVYSCQFLQVFDGSSGRHKVVKVGAEKFQALEVGIIGSSQ